MNPRSDEQLIRFIEQKRGREKAEKTQKLPYIEIDQKLGDEVIWPTVKFSKAELNTPEAIASGEELERFTSYALNNLPWEAFVMRSPAFKLADKNYHFFLVMTGEDFTSKEIITKKGIIKNVFTKDCGLFIVDHESTIMAGSDIFYYPVNGKTRMPKSTLHQLLTICDVHAVYCLAYLAMCPERVVQSTPTEKPIRQQRKLAEKDISQRVDLPTHILLDPSKAPAYQPPELRAVVEAAGRKKKPHQRRSHWRRLPEKVIRVRESWIGPKEWAYQGRTYKVIEAKSNTDNDCA